MTETALVKRPGTQIVVGNGLDLTGNLTFRELMDVSQTLVQSGFLPASIKTPQQALAIILTGRELGLPTMLALRKIHVIQGTPTLAAELQLALFKSRGGRAEVRESTDKVCKMWFKHPNGDEHIEPYTIEMAAKENLTGKDGWKKMPAKMLRWRAISGGLKIVAPEIVSGIYSPEEVGAEVNDAGEVVMTVGETEVRTTRVEQPQAGKAAVAAEIRKTAKKEKIRQQAEVNKPPEEGAQTEVQSFNEMPAALQEQGDDGLQLGGEQVEEGDAKEPEPPEYISEQQRKNLFARANERDLQGDTEIELKKIIAYVQNIPVEQASTKKVTHDDFRRICEELAAYPFKPKKSE